jgi:hypothetical protein
MARLAGEAMDLVFDRRTVSGTDALNDAGEHRRAIERTANDRVRALVSMRDPAWDLPGMQRAVPDKGEDGLRRVARLNLQHRKIDAAGVQARRGTGLQPADGQL